MASQSVKPPGNGCFAMFMVLFMGLGMAFFYHWAKKDPPIGTYIKPSTNYKGQFRKGHVRRSYSTDPNVFRRRAQSKSYYQRKGKYTRKKSKKN